jgi:hypothetical protein
MSVGKIECMSAVPTHRGNGGRVKTQLKLVLKVNGCAVSEVSGPFKGMGRSMEMDARRGANL